MLASENYLSTKGMRRFTKGGFLFTPNVFAVYGKTE